MILFSIKVRALPLLSCMTPMPLCTQVHCKGCQFLRIPVMMLAWATVLQESGNDTHISIRTQDFSWTATQITFPVLLMITQWKSGLFCSMPTDARISRHFPSDAYSKLEGEEGKIPEQFKAVLPTEEKQPKPLHLKRCKQLTRIYNVLELWHATSHYFSKLHIQKNTETCKVSFPPQ